MSQEQDTAWMDQPDAMNEGEHIALERTGDYIVCECGAEIHVEDWQQHIEEEGA